MSARKRLVLVGGGHAHLTALKRADELVAAGADVTLIAPQPYHYYSGMGPGLLSRIYRPEQCRVDVRALALSRGCRFVAGKVRRIAPEAQLLNLEDGGELPYDLVSFNTGSRVPTEHLPGASGGAIPVKPVENMEEVRRRVLEGAGDSPCRVLVVGGGPAGVELAANLYRLGRRERVAVQVSLVEGDERLLAGMPARASAIAAGELGHLGCRVHRGVRVADLSEGCARLADGAELPYDVVVLTTGIEPHDLYRSSGLPTGPRGGLSVNRFLQCVDHREMFGGGDCVSLEGNPLPRIGVYAVRQGPVLFRNLLAALQCRPLRPFRPQRRYLLILNLGDGTGLVVWGDRVARGKWGFWWKNRLDLGFMRKFQLCHEVG